MMADFELINCFRLSSLYIMLRVGSKELGEHANLMSFRFVRGKLRAEKRN
jgi:hypothetical protein